MRAFRCGALARLVRHRQLHLILCHSSSAPSLHSRFGARLIDKASLDVRAKRKNSNWWHAQGYRFASHRYYRHRYSHIEASTTSFLFVLISVHFDASDLWPYLSTVLQFVVHSRSRWPRGSSMTMMSLPMASPRASTQQKGAGRWGSENSSGGRGAGRGGRSRSRGSQKNDVDASANQNLLGESLANLVGIASGSRAKGDGIGEPSPGNSVLCKIDDATQALCAVGDAEADDNGMDFEDEEGEESDVRRKVLEYRLLVPRTLRLICARVAAQTATARHGISMTNE